MEITNSCFKIILYKNYRFRVYFDPRSGPAGINNMTDLFKNAIGYILCCIVKYTPLVRPGIQEEFNKEVRRKPRSLAFIPDIFKTPEMCIEAVRIDPFLLVRVADHFKTQEMCNEAVRNMSCTLLFVSVHLRMQ